MNSVFMFCAVLGGTIIVCQFVLTLVGFGGGDADMDADLDDLAGGAHVESPEGHDAGGHHGSTWLFSVLSFRTLVAAMTFFGLGGLLAESMQAGRPAQLVVGLILGGAAMIGVHKIMQMFYRLSEDGTVRIQRAVGLNGTVYVPIPANRAGTGKIQLSLQNRLMEYPAVTANGDALATGAKVVVISVVGTDTLEVAPVEEPAEVHAA
jgi:hypothetical protein